MGQRLSTLLGWIEELQAARVIDIEKGWELVPVSGDASFRRYFRVKTECQSWIAVDAPPEKENSQTFVTIARSWFDQGVHVPQVISVDLDQGFMLLSDFGDQLLLPALKGKSVDRLYKLAMAELYKIQCCGVESLPLYDSILLQREMALFKDWFLVSLLSIDLDSKDQESINTAFSLLEGSALEQPAVCVHRDYHSRNLMITPGHTPGVIDFQDAVKGPITYDLVSLLRDCYISWPDEQVYKWVGCFRSELVRKNPLLAEVSVERFERWFDLMGMQRHLKAIGIFARLSIRDDKHSYLQDIPRTLQYVNQISAKYPELEQFNVLINEKVLPAMRDAVAFAEVTQ
ncbi:aminoglycoside phosphotransferase family protein [Neptunomonas sp.]|uniref:aminoglycoside phosphotransferase family protein n=1 Tax=Neptunomonas sp. TaxID=1971898 RepID=UPI0035637B40